MRKKINVLLDKDVPKLGQKGEVKQVALGYAHNYLLPNDLARPATPQMVEEAKKQQEEVEKRKEAAEQQARELAQKLEGQTFSVSAPASPEGKLFAAVGENEVLEALQEAGVTHEGIKFASDPIKETGEHKVELDLGYGQKTQVTLHITSTENEGE